MKKLFLAFTATIVVATSMNAQSSESIAKSDISNLKADNKANRQQEKKDKISLRKMEGKKVSFQAEDEFGRDFPDVLTVQWNRSNYFDEATFTKDGKEMTAFYGWDAKLVGTTVPKEFNDLPATAQKDINKHYDGYTIDDVILYDDEESNDQDMVLFGNQFADEDNYFVQLSKDNKTIVLEVAMNGEVAYFTRIK